MITTTDPRTGLSAETGLQSTSAAEVRFVVASAEAAFAEVSRLGRTWRADLLMELAQALEENREHLVLLAESETGLTSVRLNGELTRCIVQFELFAAAITAGGYLEAAIDHAADTRLGPAPDIRRMLVPLGVVAVFGSSNFPFAFSVPGGDTASALAAGNTVVLKAHSAHPLTSQASFEALLEGARKAGAPDSLLGIVFGQQAGVDLVGDPGVTAVGFTGSLAAGRRLLDVANSRENPIPFYGELSSINSLAILPGAIRDRSEPIARGLADSVMGSAGQLCTKPGVAFIPSGDDGDDFMRTLAGHFADAETAVALNDRVQDSYESARIRLEGQAAVRLIEQVAWSDRPGSHVQPTLLEVDASQLGRTTVEEAFGPLLICARYTGIAELLEAIPSIPSSLTATIHANDDDSADAKLLGDTFLPRAGRIVYNGYPTGVRVSWAQNHGGPWPATNTLHTSVGVTSMRRFLRPVAWQNAPHQVLPAELRDGTISIPRLIDGRLVVATE